VGWISRALNPGKGVGFFSFPKCLSRFWAHPGSWLMGTGVLPEGRAAGAWSQPLTSI